jgi:membrane associated rhomboid family serine protease
VDVCYRHPGRETGVACSSCERPICPECMTSTPVGMRCPECAGQRTTVRKVASARPDEPMLTYVLLGLVVLVAIGSGGASPDSELLRDGEVSRATVADGELYRLLTTGFLHSGIPHLLLNGLSLWILGTMLEPVVGRLRFAVIYFVSLLAGAFGALLLEAERATVGASGAIFGLMGAAFVVMRHRGIDPMQSGLGLWLGLNLILSFRPGISLGGHLGGLVGGALVALILFELRDRVRLPRSAPLLLAAAVGVLAVAGSILVSA